MRKAIAAAGVAAGLVGGGIVGAAVSPIGVSGAQEAEDGGGDHVVRPEPGEWIADALAPLVEDGTLTEAQVDAVTEALREARPKPPGHRPGRPGRHGHRLGDGVVAEALGIEPEALAERLRGGETIAEVAADLGVPVDDVVAAMVAAADERLAEAVEAGRLTQEQADEIAAGNEERFRAIVAGERPEPPELPEGVRPPSRRGRGPGGPPPFAPGAGGGDAEATPTAST